MMTKDAATLLTDLRGLKDSLERLNTRMGTQDAARRRAPTPDRHATADASALYPTARQNMDPARQGSPAWWNRIFRGPAR